jgi:hypothetical protein
MGNPLPQWISADPNRVCASPSRAWFEKEIQRANDARVVGAA